MLDIIGNRKFFLAVSGSLVALGILAVPTLGFKEGIDFQGGTLLDIAVKSVVSPEELKTFLNNEFHSNASVVRGSGGGFLIRLQTISEEEHQEYLRRIVDKFPKTQELSFQSIGPTIGKELRNRALLALAMVLIAISLYIAFAFRKASRPVTSWKYGVVTLLTLFHDIAIPAGLVALLGYARGLEIDTNFIVALLVVMGFSVHDTIVVFDRIRENLIRSRDRHNFSSIVNTSVNETIARSINTSLTLVIVLIALLLFGPVTLTYFVLVLLVGVIAGTYSSIFVASPLLTVWHDIAKRP